MKKPMIVLALAMTFSAHAVELLKCRTQAWNPIYDFTVTKDAAQRMNGKLDRSINGYAGVSRTTLGTNQLKLKLNPSTCELMILSNKNTEAQFHVLLPLNEIGVRTGYAAGNKKFFGTMSGNVLGATYRAECSPHDSDLVRSLQNVCERNPSIDAFVEFNKTTDVIQYIARSPEVSDRQDRPEVRGDILEYRAPDPFAIHQ